MQERSRAIPLIIGAVVMVSVMFVLLGDHQATYFGLFRGPAGPGLILIGLLFVGLTARREIAAPTTYRLDNSELVIERRVLWPRRLRLHDLAAVRFREVRSSRDGVRIRFGAFSFAVPRPDAPIEAVQIVLSFRGHVPVRITAPPDEIYELRELLTRLHESRPDLPIPNLASPDANVDPSAEREAVTPATPPPGWYPQDQSGLRRRWWDGRAWTSSAVAWNGHEWVADITDGTAHV